MVNFNILYADEISVYELKVNQEDVNCNQCSYEVEFDKSSLIINGKIYEILKRKHSLILRIQIVNICLNINLSLCFKFYIIL